MPFNIQALTRIGDTTGMDVTKNFTTGVGTPLGGVNVWSYNGITSGDTQAVIAAANYFNSQAQNFQVGDTIFVWDNANVFAAYSVTAVNYATNVVTIVVFNFGAAPVGTANITNNAVTYAKIQQVAADSILGNPTGAPANVSEITLEATGSLAFVGTTLGVNSNLIRYATGTLTNANIAGMFAAPVQLLANPGAGNMYVVYNWALNAINNVAAFGGGGVVGVQFGTTANLPAASRATDTIDGGIFSTDATHRVAYAGGVFAQAASAGLIAGADATAGLYISNATGAFTTGGGATGTARWELWYSIVTNVT